MQLPDKAVLAETGKSVSIDEIQIGTRIVVCAGERIALDGEVVKGQAAIDESSITGEAIPVEKGLGSQTYSGTIVQSGFLEVREKLFYTAPELVYGFLKLLALLTGFKSRA